MQAKEKVLLHNKFEIEVVDAATGELKQKAYAYNVIVNYYFSSRLTGSPLGVSADLLRYIALGTGMGTPAITDTYSKQGHEFGTALASCGAPAGPL